MSVLFAAGNSYAQREKLKADMHKHLATEEGSDIIIVVPGQLTLEAEQLALSASGRQGSFRLQVYSVDRLCQAIINHEGVTQSLKVDDNGRVMLMRRAIDSLEEPLLTFERSRKSAGFAALAARMCMQWKEAGLGVDDMQAIAEKQGDSLLGKKIRDIAALTQALEQVMQGLSLDSEDLRRAAVELLPRSGLFTGSLIWFYGFDMLTCPTAEMITALASCAEQVTVFVNLAQQGEKGVERLYAPVQRTFVRLTDMLAAAGISWKRMDIALPDRKDRAARILEKQLYAHPIEPQEQERRDVRLYAAMNPRDEVEYLASAVRETVRQNGWKYSDIAIACQNSTALYGPLKRVFGIFGIPIFFPDGRSALTHPLCASLLAAVHMASGTVSNSDPETILSLGYSPLTDDEADTMRNFAFENGISGRKYLREWRPGRVDPDKDEWFEEMRRKCFEPVIKLSAAFKRGTTRDRVEAVYTYLCDIDAMARMKSEAETLSQSGELLAAAEGPEVWNRIMTCMDQIVNLYDSAKVPISGKTLYELMHEALSATEIKPLPQSQDAVNAGDLEHMKTKPVRMLIIAGCTDSDEGSIPSMLTDAEQSALSKEVWLGPDKMERMQLKMLAARNAISMAESYICVTWHVNTTDGSVCRPGMLARSVQAIFSGNKVQGGAVADNSLSKLRLMQKDNAFEHIGIALQSGQDLTEEEKAAISALGSIPEYRKKLEKLEGALQGDVLPGTIDPKTAGKLYSNVSHSSVSRLETFAKCPFMYFIRHGARPEILEEYGVTARRSGTFCHAAIDRYTKMYSGETDVETAVQRIDEITHGMIAEYFPYLDEEDAVERYNTEALRDTARRAAVTILRQMGISKFRPEEAEMAFEGEDALEIDHTRIEGKIDRVDLWKDPETGEQYLKITDYKRGGKVFSLQDVYYGLQLQLLIYMIAAGQKYNAEYAACLYFNVSDPLVEDAGSDEAVEESRDKELRLKGAVLNDIRIVRALSDPTENVASIKILQSGELGKSDSLFDQGELHALADHAVACAREDIRRIRKGEIAANPAVLEDRSPCEYCEVRDVCRYDPRLAAERQRKLPKLKKEEIMQKIMGER